MSVEYINLGEYWYCMNRIAWWLVRNNKQFKKRNLYGFDGKAVDLHTMETAIRDRGDNVALDGMVAEYVECAIFDNTDLSFLPAYVTCSDGKTKLYLDTYVDMANRVSAFEVLKGKSPSIVYIKANNTTNTSTPALDAFEKRFGKCEYIDDALAKIRGKGYAFYFSDKFTIQTTIDNIANGKGANCYDSAELGYRLAYDMNTKYGRNYTVQFLHVWCPVSNYDHIRLRLKTTGDWFYRDPASVLDGGSVESNWCGTSNNIMEVNPSWLLTSVKN